VVLPIQIEHPSPDWEYEWVQVRMEFRKHSKHYPDDGVDVLSYFPVNLDQISDVNTKTRITAGLEWLFAKLGLEFEEAESFRRRYRQVEAYRSDDPAGMRWLFTKVLGEPVAPGTFYAIAIIEDRSGLGYGRGVTRQTDPFGRRSNEKYLWVQTDCLLKEDKLVFADSHRCGWRTEIFRVIQPVPASLRPLRIGLSQERVGSEGLQWRTTSQGRYLGWVRDGAWLYLGEWEFGPGGYKSINARVASAEPGFRGEIEVILDTLEPWVPSGAGRGDKVAFLYVQSTGGWDNYATRRGFLSDGVIGKRRVYLRFRGPSQQYLFNLKWIEFSPEPYFH
jgi:hypothetical protein